MKTIILLAVFSFVLLLFLPGCSNQTIYVPNGQAVRLRGTIKNAPVWVKTEKGDVVSGVMNLPEGWYCLPDSDK